MRSLRHRSFLLYWWGLAMMQVGFWTTGVALQWLTARLSDNSSAELGLLYFFNFVPLLFLTPWAGVIADRYHRVAIVVLCQCGIGVAAAALAAYLALSGERAHLILIYSFAFGIGTLMAVNAPASQAIVAATVPAKDLSSAVGLQSVTLNIARIAGPVVAVPLLVAWGAAPVFIAYAATSALTALLVGRLRLAAPPPRGHHERTWQRLREGLHHVRTRPTALRALLMAAATSVFGGSYVSQLPVVAYTVADAADGDTALALLIATTGLGAVVGALATSWRTSIPNVRWIAALMILLALVTSLLAGVGSLLPALLFAVVAAALNFTIMTGLNVVLQALSTDHVRGRVMSLFIIAWGGLVPVGALLLGALADRIGVFGAVTALATLQAIIGLVFLTHRQEDDPLGRRREH